VNKYSYTIKLGTSEKEYLIVNLP